MTIPVCTKAMALCFTYNELAQGCTSSTADDPPLSPLWSLFRTCEVRYMLQGITIFQKNSLPPSTQGRTKWLNDFSYVGKKARDAELAVGSLHSWSLACSSPARPVERERERVRERWISGMKQKCSTTCSLIFGHRYAIFWVGNTGGFKAFRASSSPS